MLIPIGVDVPTDRRPWVNYLLVGAIVVVSFMAFGDEGLYRKLSGIEIAGSGSDYEGLMSAYELHQFDPSPMMYPVYAVTSCFVHAGLWHLLGNMLFLWIFGNAMNYKFGHAGYLGLFLLVAVVSGLAHYATSDLPAVGASGAIYGVMGAFAVFFPRNDVRLLFWISIFVRHFTVSSLWIILMWVAWDAFYVAVGAETGVAHWSHLGGFLAGFGVAFGLAAAGVVRSDPDEQTLLEWIGSRAR